MDKYGVAQNSGKTKTASAGADDITCPECGTKFKRDTNANVVLCPKCGSKPFEGRSSE